MRISFLVIPDDKNIRSGTKHEILVNIANLLRIDFILANGMLRIFRRALNEERMVWPGSII